MSFIHKTRKNCSLLGLSSFWLSLGRAQAQYTRFLVTEWLRPWFFLQHKLSFYLSRWRLVYFVMSPRSRPGTCRYMLYHMRSSQGNWMWWTGGRVRVLLCHQVSMIEQRLSNWSSPDHWPHHGTLSQWPAPQIWSMAGTLHPPPPYPISSHFDPTAYVLVLLGSSWPYCRRMKIAIHSHVVRAGREYRLDPGLELVKVIIIKYFWGGRRQR